ncbi:MAG: histone deacetylase family protein [Candidatus Auribacter fodinae]|jgi:acetoin utilization deacetylase AcuC-like enzyme/GNAT superfamily N-acetyltransferase|uniref:Histone deacetylase family protein n=1 Tax=Candidatus Auribacter fodinae TaxID=2093366 RepID=A0A3A4R117_9BACT|nr:MAG: histone deacetylase family protein [Candidatus Auribacter fodinae]
MFSIRRIYDDVLPVDRHALSQVQQILREQFPLVSSEDIEKIPVQLKDPLTFQYRVTLFVAEDLRGTVRGFALLLYFSDLNFCYLDYISAARLETGKGIGGILYERVREEALELGAVGLFMECLPDDPALCRDKKILKQNQARLVFYERFGVRPIANTKYETPLKPEDDNPPYLLFDDLGRKKPLQRNYARRIVRTILERKYPDVCPTKYISMVVSSFKDNPIKMMEFRYIKPEQVSALMPHVPDDKKIILTVNDIHEIHHVRERGYVESPVRIKAIKKELERTNLFLQVKTKHYPQKNIEAVHDKKYVDYFKSVCEVIEKGKSIYPYVFPIRNRTRPPVELPMRAGYYCIDTFTPINENAWCAAKRAVDCALTAADFILKGSRLAYALVRPPGHHAEINSFGGFCYLNSAAIAAHRLSRFGKVAILDIDYHHGNGQQHIFYNRNDVLTISIHGHPKFAYPFFTGFKDEKGEGDGLGFNVNYPLPEKITPEKYCETLQNAIGKIEGYQPEFVVVALGVDTAKGDPTGTWSMRPADFFTIGKLIGAIKKPILFSQEGGYNSRQIGVNVRQFFQGVRHTHR